MPTHNTREKRVSKMNIPHLLVDEFAFQARIARNLNLLASEILSDEEKVSPQVNGRKLLEAVDLLPMEEHMVIVKYYGLIGPNFKPMPFSAIATEHNVSIPKISELKKKGLERLRITAYKTIFHSGVRAAAEDKVIYSQKYVELSFLYKGFKATNAYRVFKAMGIKYIQELADADLHKLGNQIDEKGYELRYCDLLQLAYKANNMSYTDEFLDTIALTLEEDGDMIIQKVADLVRRLSEDTITALTKADIISISEFLNLTDEEIQVAVMGNLLQVAEIKKVRAELGFPVRE